MVMDLVAHGAMVYAALRKAIEIADKAGDLEMKAALLDVMEYNQELRQRVIDLEASKAYLTEQLALKEQLVFRDDNLYWRRTDDAGGFEGPYCPKCRDGDVKLAHMARVPASEGTTAGFRCVVCAYYARQNPNEPDPPLPRRRVTSSGV